MTEQQLGKASPALGAKELFASLVTNCSLPWSMDAQRQLVLALVSQGTGLDEGSAPVSARPMFL